MPARTFLELQGGKSLLLQDLTVLNRSHASKQAQGTSGWQWQHYSREDLESNIRALCVWL